MTAPLLLVVAVALIDRRDRILLAQRPEGKAMAGLWEFPGGKVETGETPEEALRRELDEELGLMVRTSSLTPLTFASHAYQSFHLLMPLYVCRDWAGEPRPCEGQRIAWVERGRLKEFPAPAADEPLFRALAADGVG